jgi:hypothetical protein
MLALPIHICGPVSMQLISPDEFDVDLIERRVTHRASGIWFSFYEYLNEDDWLKSDSVTYRDNPRWEGDRNLLAASAKNAAVVGGMSARRPISA